LRLHLHRPVDRIPASFRYQVTDFGLRVALFYTWLCNRLLRPGLDAALPVLRAINDPLRRVFETLSAKIDAAINNAQLAIQNLTRLSKVSFVIKARVKTH
jgi:hypothetical protein